MPLLKDGKVVDDPWITVADDADMPGDGPVILSLDRWLENRDDLLKRNAPVGIVLRSDQPPTLVADWLDRFGVVALDFPKFTDGRAYSYARMLRQRFAYTGEVRAVGDVLRDQLLFMHRCGFDAFEMRSETAEEDWREALGEIDVFYQPGADARRSVMQARRDAAEASGVATE